VELTLVQDPAECRQLWNRWSPRASLYDLWEYRLPFLEVYGFTLAFAHIKEGNDELGLLPLWFHPQQKRYMWFGDVGDEFNWQEDTTFWLQDSALVPKVLEMLPRPVILTDLTPTAAAQIGSSPQLRAGNPKSVLPLNGLSSVEDYLTSLPRKLRQNTRRDQRRIDAAGILVVPDRREDYEALMDLNTGTFADSPFHDGRLRDVFRRIVQNKKGDPFGVHFFTAILNDKIVGVDCIFVWNKTYYPLLCGYDKQGCPGIGHYMNLVDIEHALSLGMERMDFAETEHGMLKEKLFPVVEQYVFESA